MRTNAIYIVARFSIQFDRTSLSLGFYVAKYLVFSDSKKTWKWHNGAIHAEGGRDEAETSRNNGEPSRDEHSLISEELVVLSPDGCA